MQFLRWSVLLLALLAATPVALAQDRPARPERAAQAKPDDAPHGPGVLRLLPPDAVNEKEITLGDVMRFKVGSTILLDCMPEDEVVLKCSGVPISRGKLGRIGEHMAVSISEPIVRQQEEL